MAIQGLNKPLAVSRCWPNACAASPAARRCSLGDSPDASICLTSLQAQHIAIGALETEVHPMLPDLMDFLNSPEEFACTWCNGELTIEPIESVSAKAAPKPKLNKQPR